MTADHDRDELDAVLRRAAAEAASEHRRSIGRDETERALRATRALLDATPMPASRQRRTAALAVAAVASVALVGVLVIVGGRGTSVSDDPAPATIETSTTVSTTVVPATTSPRVPLVRTPSVLFDVDGNRLVGAGFDDGERTAFGEVLRDYLIHRSDILGDSVAERESRLERGGLRIHTTLDPDAQAAADAASEVLPSNAAGFRTAIVSLDTGSAAVRALVGPPSEDTSGGDTNAAVAARATGSAVRAFVVAAAADAGVRADDIIDSTRPCFFPSDDPGTGDFEILGGVAGGIESIRLTFARSYSCGVERLSRAVGLDIVVETMYAMAATPYLDRTAVSSTTPSEQLTINSHRLSPLDLASGMQTIANEGIHHVPYFVEYIDDADGNRVYTHLGDGERVLRADASLETIDILEAVVVSGTGQRAALAGDRRAIGVTGTEPDDANAWFVGATPQLTTAVWVGDPAADTPMVDIREFVAVGVGRVQGGTFPADIWKAFTDAALADEPPIGWARPSEPVRAAGRVVVPGVDCRAGNAADERPQPIEPQQPVTIVDLATAIVPCDDGQR